mmetsp:Transcript_9756/g.31774  ORF Transcript_9756/g.31774 Transcript_9756/m.31774 type:complete len:933 (-) Transcript_9756:152-2950(-)
MSGDATYLRDISPSEQTFVQRVCGGAPRFLAKLRKAEDSQGRSTSTVRIVALSSHKLLSIKNRPLSGLAVLRQGHLEDLAAMKLDAQDLLRVYFKKGYDEAFVIAVPWETPMTASFVRTLWEAWHDTGGGLKDEAEAPHVEGLPAELTPPKSAFPRRGLEVELYERLRDYYRRAPKPATSELLAQADLSPGMFQWTSPDGSSKITRLDAAAVAGVLRHSDRFDGVTLDAVRIDGLLDLVFPAIAKSTTIRRIALRDVGLSPPNNGGVTVGGSGVVSGVVSGSSGVSSSGSGVVSGDRGGAMAFFPSDLFDARRVAVDLSKNKLGDRGAAILADALKTAHALECLTLRQCQLKPSPDVAGAVALFERVASTCLNLRVLDLSGNQLQATGMGCVSWFVRTSVNLRVLDVSDNRALASALLSSILETKAPLTSVDVSRNTIRVDATSSFGGLGGAKEPSKDQASLREILQRCDRITTLRFAAMRYQSALTSLLNPTDFLLAVRDFAADSAKTTTSTPSFVKDFVDISGSHIQQAAASARSPLASLRASTLLCDDVAVDAIAFVVQNPIVERLSLRRCTAPIQFARFAEDAFARWGYSRLSSLSLKDSNFGPALAPLVRALPPSLEILDVENCNSGDAGLDALATLLRQPACKIRRLRCDGQGHRKVTIVGLRSIMDGVRLSSTLIDFGAPLLDARRHAENDGKAYAAELAKLVKRMRRKILDNLFPNGTLQSDLPYADDWRTMCDDDDRLPDTEVPTTTVDALGDWLDAVDAARPGLADYFGPTYAKEPAPRRPTVVVPVAVPVSAKKKTTLLDADDDPDDPFDPPPWGHDTNAENKAAAAKEEDLSMARVEEKKDLVGGSDATQRNNKLKPPPPPPPRTQQGPLNNILGALRRGDDDDKQIDTAAVPAKDGLLDKITGRRQQNDDKDYEDEEDW